MLMNIGTKAYLQGTDIISIGLFAGFAFCFVEKASCCFRKSHYLFANPCVCTNEEQSKTMHLRLHGPCSLDSLFFFFNFLFDVEYS